MILYACLRQHFKTPLFANAYFFIATAVATSGLGFIFWQLVANHFAPDSVGRASGYMSTIALISSIGNLGVGFAIVRFLSATKGSLRARLINSSYTLTGLATLGVGGAYLVVSDRLTPALGYANDSIGSGLAVLGFALVWTWYGLSDQVFTAYRAGKYVLWKNLLANLLKIPLPLLVLTSARGGIEASTALAMTAALVWIFVVALPAVQPGYQAKLTLSSGQPERMIRYSLPNYVAAWLWQAPNMILPIIVLNRFGAESNAEFFVAWMIASLVNVIGASFAGSLFAELSHEPSSLKFFFWRTTILAVSLQAAVALTIWLVRAPLLGLFGPTYVENSVEIVRILLLGSFGFTLSALAQSILRAASRLRALTLVSAVPLTCLGLGAWLHPDLGMPHLAGYWLLGVTGSATLALLLGRLGLNASIALKDPLKEIDRHFR